MNEIPPSLHIQEALNRPKPEAVSLLDIGFRSKIVTVNDKQLRIYGLTSMAIEIMLERFPELQHWIVGRGFMVDKIALVPKITRAIIAAAVGKLGDEDYERAAGNLSPEDQMEVIREMMTLTFPKGFGPFVQALVAGVTLGASGGRAPDTRSPSSSPDMTAPPPSTPGASPQDSSPPTPSSPSSTG